MTTKVDIDPKTGTPIVVLADSKESKESVSDFVASVQSHIESQNDETKEQPDEKGSSVKSEIPASGPGNPTPQHAHLIESAKKFNENLHSPKSIQSPATLGIPYPIQMNIGIEAQIRAVLKDGGMDTQQQDKSMNRIAEILSTAKQSVSQ